MSKPSRRPGREEIKAQRRKKKQLEKELRDTQRSQGLTPKTHTTSSNATSPYDSVEAEREGRLDAVTGQMRIIKAQLPQLLKHLNQIPDPRNPKKLKHSLTLLMLYGLLMFVFHLSSRRQANREMTHPQFKENVRLLFPELNDLPHADSLFRLLSRIDTNQIEQTLVELIHRLIAKKTFRRYLINNCYPIAIDGTQKMPFNAIWCEQLLQRRIKKGKTADPIDGDTDTEQDKHQYYVYVLEANLTFQNGMVIPLLSEFLEYEQGDMENNKQDCEQRAFKRLAERLKDYFPRLPILLLLDGLYANGPIMAQCHKHRWQFMIVLKDDSLPSVWEEFDSLLKLLPNNHYSMSWGERRQSFKWVNEIDYCYGPSGRNRMALHVAVCNEEWEEVDNNAEIIPKHSRHAWISSRPLNRNNLHERCNLGARYRWGIEACILVEKHQGYHYEHSFALNWQAMKGYHYLMRLAHLFNTLARFSCALAKVFKKLGVRGFIAFVYSTLTGPWL
ncbi:MAG: transposase family protein, partial [Sedimenticola sp.]